MWEAVTRERPSIWPVFLCYRQSDGPRAAERLFSILTRVGAAGGAAEDQLRLDVYFDQTAPGVGDYPTTVHEPYLKRARAFIMVCTPGAKLDEEEGDWVQPA